MKKCLQRWATRGLFLWLAGFSFPAHAQTNSWTSTANGKWETASNWSTGTPSGSDSAVLITNDLTKAVTIDAVTTNTPAMMTISNLTLSAPVGSTNTLFLNNAGSLTPLIVLSNVTVGVGGAVRLANSQLQANGRSASRFVVDGALTLEPTLAGSSSLVVTGRIEVGRSANGILTLNAGTVTAQVGLFLGESAGVTGTVWVSNGQMLINGVNGSQFGVGGGVARVTVSNGTMQVVNLLVGRSAGMESTLTLAGGTTTLLSFCLVGYDPGAGGAVWVTGGQLDARNFDTTIGYQGIGRMTVSDGAVVANTMYVGRYSGSRGELTILDGEMSVLSGLTVGSGDCVSTATVLLAGGQLSVTNAAHNATLVIQSGTFTQSGGTLTVDNLYINSSCARFIHAGGTLIINGSITANLAYDSDGDGIPNGYEDSHGFDKFYPADASVDSDGDGLTNLQEYQAGTDPTNNASAFRIIGVTQEGNDVRIAWTMGSSKTNALQATAGGILTNTFTDLFMATNTTDTVTNYLELGVATNFPSRFYRIRLVP